jgi:TolB protein
MNMRPFLVLRSLTAAMALSLTTTAAGAQSSAPLGIFDGETDVGHVSPPGTTTYDAATGEYHLSGAGQNMWATHDDFHFVWKKMTGNFILSTRVRFIGAGVDPHRKVGWSIRTNLEPTSPHVSIELHGDGRMSLQARRTPGATTEEFMSADTNPDFLQLERRDGVYIMSVAKFGDTLVSREVPGLVLPDTVYAGIFICAHRDTVTERAVYSNVRITKPAWAGLTPYRDYLGSSLEILDVASGNATIVHQYKGSFQAPNWTHDGKALIYAQEGKLYRFDLASRTPEVINTDFANRNNNDHVLSFDGTMMGISHHTASDSGRSIVYTLPATGGVPKRITAKGPS